MLETLSSYPWNTWTHLPWKALRSPVERFDDNPSHLAAELLFFLCWIGAFFHACSRSRRHLLAWLSCPFICLVSAALWMSIGGVDNFWHAQGTVMLTPRLPAYMCCVYTMFLYVPWAAAERMHLPVSAEGTIAGLAALLIYIPFDIAGAKFIWWTWHDTDSTLIARMFGAPLCSPLWIITFTLAFCLLLRLVPENIKFSWFPVAVVLLAITSTPLMVVFVAMLQGIEMYAPGSPGAPTLIFAICIYVLVFLWGLASCENDELRLPRRRDSSLWLMIGLYFAAIVTISASVDPATLVSIGLHQPPGDCTATEIAFSGIPRNKFLCVEDFTEDFVFCAHPRSSIVPSDPRWYTICGKAFEPEIRKWHLTTVTSLAFFGTMLFRYMLLSSGDKHHHK
eukprot:gnl/Spiro4/5869_TR3000_c0_g1_i1.p1 gnl/Spiro4/5869_TR3000_c0_g1~~gnl/Spiro4/5869_TR3000_c0_g1_i1.p1  ORF type:complete len:394 (+),score=69.62 gnl/Spiro4/5869_TR3000_c0_g1_i1:61-1242(+)